MHLLLVSKSKYLSNSIRKMS